MKLTTEILREMVNKELDNQICESSLSRIEHWIETQDIATISACRKELKDVTDNTFIGGLEIGHKFTSAENLNRTRQLKAKLLKLGYGVTEIGGTYIEGLKSDNPIPTVENSFFVTNINDDPNFFDELFKLSEYFNQDSFLYKPKGKKQAYLYGTNEDMFIGYGNRRIAGVLHLNVKYEYLSRIGNKAFSFNRKWKTQQHDDLENTFNSRKEFRKQQDAENRKDPELKRQEKIARRAARRENDALDLELNEDIKRIFTEDEWSKCQVNTKHVISEIARKVRPKKNNIMLQKVRSELVSL